MLILSHRGNWDSSKSKNSKQAIFASLDQGYGVETDVRDWSGKLVISHDPIMEPKLELREIFEYYVKLNSAATLALNVKSDGLSDMVKKCLARYQISSYFVFDMSVPDALSYLKNRLNVFTRQSEYENSPSYYDLAKGVWLDEFHRHWITGEIIEGHIRNGKKVAIVSPELHGRPHEAEWEDYKEVFHRIGTDNLMLCTDFPDLARQYFNA